MLEARAWTEVAFIIGEQMLYNPPTIEDPPAPKKVVKGYTKKEVKKFAKEAAEKTAAEWNEYACYLRARKGALSAALRNVIEGHIDGRDEEAIRRFLRGRERQIASELGIDFDEAREKFDF